MRRRSLLHAPLVCALVLVVAGCDASQSVQPAAPGTARLVKVTTGSGLEGLNASIAIFRAIAADPNHYHLVSSSLGQNATATDMVAYLERVKARYTNRKSGPNAKLTIVAAPTTAAFDMGTACAGFNAYCSIYGTSSIWDYGYPPNSRTVDFHGATTCSGYMEYTVTHVESNGRLASGYTASGSMNGGGYAYVDLTTNLTGLPQAGTLSSKHTCTPPLYGGGWTSDVRYSSAQGNV
jgi:hypothetical protein